MEQKIRGKTQLSIHPQTKQTNSPKIQYNITTRTITTNRKTGILKTESGFSSQNHKNANPQTKKNKTTGNQVTAKKKIVRNHLTQTISGGRTLNFFSKLDAAKCMKGAAKNY
jgi:hypothetical protein